MPSSKVRDKWKAVPGQVPLSLLGPTANNVTHLVNHGAWISLLEIAFWPLFLNF